MSTAITDVVNPYHKLGLVHLVQNAKELVQMATVELSISDMSECKEQVAAFLNPSMLLKKKKDVCSFSFPQV